MEKKGYPDRKIGYDIFRIFACFGVILNHTILIYDRYGEIHPWKYLVVTALFCLCKSAVTIYLLLSSALLLKKEESYRDWFFKRLLRMIFILIVWSIIYIDTNEWRKSNSLIHTISTIISRESSLHLWYLYMFLGICIMLPFLRKMVAGMKKEEMISLVKHLNIIFDTVRIVDLRSMNQYVYIDKEGIKKETEC